MPKIGINYLYWIGTGADDTPEDVLQLTHAAGADVMEYSAPKLAALTQAHRQDLRKKAEDLGMTIAVTGGMGGDFDLASEDTDQRRRSIELARQALNVCHDVGSIDWCGVIYSKWFDPPKAPLTQDFRKRMWDRAVGSLKEVVKTCEDLDVILSIEILNRFEVYLLTTVAEGMKFTDDIGSPYAKLLMDVFHMNIEEDCMVDTIVKALDQDKMGHLHVTEANRRPPGLVKTDMDWTGIFGAVKKGGYDRTISIEPFVIMDSPFALSGKSWRDLVPDTSAKGLIESASKSIQFIRSKLA